MTTVTPDELSVGRVFEIALVEDLKRVQIVQYAGASGDYNPLHTDEVYSTQVAGFPSVFAHGMLTMGMAGRAVADLVGGDRLLRFGVRFTAQVWPGDTLTLSVGVDRLSEEDGHKVAELSVTATNQDDRVVVSGYAIVRLGG
jgi:acyl dehydratase